MPLHKSLLYLLVLASVLHGCARQPAQDIEEEPAKLPESGQTEMLRILFLGNSLAAGLGLDPAQAFPALIGARAAALGWPVRVVNAGVSGETTAGGLGRIDWLLKDRVDILVIELGANDGMRGIDPVVTKSNLQAIVERTRARYPEAAIVLAGMQIPTNLGPSYTESFRRIYPDLARENNLTLIPFLLEGVGGLPELNQPDGIHPTAEGHALIAENVWQVLRPILEARLAVSTDPPSSQAPQPDS